MKLRIRFPRWGLITLLIGCTSKTTSSTAGTVADDLSEDNGAPPSSPDWSIPFAGGNVIRANRIGYAISDNVMQGADTAADMALLASSGAHMVRTGLQWPQLETETPGNYENLEKVLDSFLLLGATNNLSFVLQMGPGGSNPLYISEKKTEMPPWFAVQPGAPARA